MKVLFVNTSERTGGAAVAAGRIVQAVRAQGIEARLLVRDRATDDPGVSALKPSRKQKWYFLRERLGIWLHNRLSRKDLFAVSTATAGFDITRHPDFQEADLIHLHWINQGFLSLRTLYRILHCGKPVVWTMHDMWPCTGICHHARHCTAFHKECRGCFFLHHEGNGTDLATRIFRRKMRCYDKAPLTFVGCSRWIADRARASALTEGHAVTDIPNPIDTTFFTPRDKAEARAACGLPREGKLILFGSAKITDERKGGGYLAEACRILAEKDPRLKESLGVVVFGQNSHALESLLPFRIYPMEYLHDMHRIACLYSAVDLFVTPSLEENLPNMLMEAMACGTPCVGFRTGGIPEMIDHRTNGYVARYRSAEDLAAGIDYVLHAGNHDELSRNAVEKVHRTYSQEAVGRRYAALYRSLIHTENA